MEGVGLILYADRDLTHEWLDTRRFNLGTHPDHTFARHILETFKTVLEQTAAENGIPILIQFDQLTSGKLFRGETEDVLLVSHPKESYGVKLVRVQLMGNFAFVYTFTVVDGLQGLLVVSDDEEGIMATVSRFRNAVSGHKSKYEKEKQYQNVLKTCFEDAFQRLSE